MSLRTYQAVGKCIYCGADRYSPDSDRVLAVEHIVPLSLGGLLELPEASCQACERVTGRIDSIATNNHLVGPRRFLGLKGRTPRSKAAKQLPLFVQQPNGPDRKVMIDVEDYPSWLFLPQLPDPPLLRHLKNLPPADGYVGFWVASLNHKPEVLKEKYGLDQSYSQPAVFMPVFCRMIAKIAHSLAVAEFGLNGFIPCLSDILRDPNRQAMNILPFVGGALPEPAQETLHAMQPVWIEVSGMTVLVVLVRLFASLGAPIYAVVTGSKPGANRPPLPNDPVLANALRQLGTQNALLR